MTVKELKKILELVPDDMDVFVSDRTTDFKYGLVNSAYVKKIGFQEEPDSKILSNEKVFVLGEE